MPRKQNDNLKPARTKSEARERGKNGGKASGIARRKKKALKEEFEILLSMPLKSAALKDNLKKIGLNADDEMTIQTAIVAAMLQQASNGNVKAFQAIRDAVTPSTNDSERKDNGVTKIIIQPEDASEAEDDPND